MSFKKLDTAESPALPFAIGHLLFARTRHSTQFDSIRVNSTSFLSTPLSHEPNSAKSPASKDIQPSAFPQKPQHLKAHQAINLMKLNPVRTSSLAFIQKPINPTIHHSNCWNPQHLKAHQATDLIVLTHSNPNHPLRIHPSSSPIASGLRTAIFIGVLQFRLVH